MLEDIIRERRKKLDRILRVGIHPYPAEAKRTHKIAQAREKFAQLSASKKSVTLSGRLLSSRDQGNIVFLDLADGTGKIQAVLKSDSLKEFDFWKSSLDIGDFVSVEGALFVTRKGEQSVEARKLILLAKSLRPIPSGWYGVEDTETRLRKRYLDILLNPETKEIFRKKEIFWDAIRSFLKKRGFMEVETPALEGVVGGADAEPFKTHHNALDADFYLRISLELPLKKLLVGGFEKVFEIGRVFRNEGIDREHLQDYTQLEFYWAYADYEDLMKLVEKLYKTTIQKTLGTLTTVWQGKKIEWGGTWPRVDYVEAFREANRMDPTSASHEELFERAKSLGLAPEAHLGKGRLIDLIYKKTVRPRLIQPAFLVNTPVEASPLSKRSEKNPAVAERVQMIACCSELGNGWSELNDPLDQRARFEEQMKLRAAGDREAQMLDEDFLEALEYGMPPAAGFGLSERLFAVLMDKPVRETVIFPLMRPKK